MKISEYIERNCAMPYIRKDILKILVDQQQVGTTLSYLLFRLTDRIAKLNP